MKDKIKEKRDLNNRIREEGLDPREKYEIKGSKITKVSDYGQGSEPEPT
jgi:hypothetical protein